jgi:hypothetical protein
LSERKEGASHFFLAEHVRHRVHKAVTLVFALPFAFFTMASDDDDGEWVTIQRRKPKAKQTPRPVERATAYGRASRPELAKPILGKDVSRSTPAKPAGTRSSPAIAQQFRPQPTPTLHSTSDFPSLAGMFSRWRHELLRQK